MAVVGRNEEIVLLTQQSSKRRDIGIDKRAQHLREQGPG
jgi:hypothetical protein